MEIGEISVKSRVGRLSMLPLLAWLIAGCTHAIPLKGNLEPPPDTKRLPLAVGIYYSPDLKAYEHVGARSGDWWAFPLGPASTKLFDKVFPIAFESAPVVPNLPPLNPVGPQVAAVIEPRIEAFDFDLPFLKTGTYRAEITYRFTLYSPQGESLASWTVTGVGAKPSQVGFEFARWPGEAADLAMQDAASKFLTGFRDVPEVRKWLRQVGAPGITWIPRWILTTFGRG